MMSCLCTRSRPSLLSYISTRSSNVNVYILKLLPPLFQVPVGTLEPDSNTNLKSLLPGFNNVKIKFPTKLNTTNTNT